MVLQATAEGLGTCWIGAFYEEEVKKVLNIPPEVRVVALLPMGYPDESPFPRPRKVKDEIVAFETWG